MEKVGSATEFHAIKIVAVQIKMESTIPQKKAVRKLHLEYGIVPVQI